MKTLIALRHVAFEDLGGLQKFIEALGYRIAYRDMWVDDVPPNANGADALVILGAPIAVYESTEHGFIRDQIGLVEDFLGTNKPVLGICFGAQIIARALGARVFEGGAFEYGWTPINLTQEGRSSPISAYGDQEGHVFQCHGDTFDLPAGATRLAGSDAYENQAFRYGSALGIQFHGEVTRKSLRQWFIAQAPRARTWGGLERLRWATERYGPSAERAQKSFVAAWLSSDA